MEATSIINIWSADPIKYKKPHPLQIFMGLADYSALLKIAVHGKIEYFSFFKGRAMIKIDYKKCSKCGLCIKDCISGVFQQEKDRPIICHTDWCIGCGHCVALCPKRAIIHEKLSKETLASRVQRKHLQPKPYKEIVRSRRSIRYYKQKSVPKEILEEILDLARFSPTAGNDQNVHYTVVTQKRLMDAASKRIFGIGERIYRIFPHGSIQGMGKLIKNQKAIKALDRYAKSWNYFQEQTAAGRDLVFHQAPALILIHAPKGQGMAKDNCLIASLNIANYAHAIGLGSCFIGVLVLAMQIDRYHNKNFKIPRNHRVHAALTIGYPTFQYVYHAARKPVKVQWL